MAPPKADKRPDPLFMAQLALNVAAELSGNGRLVAGVLLDHFNRRTQHCYPAIPTIVDLTGLSRTSVVRALGELCDERGGTDETKFFERWPHHGRGNATFYLVRWRRFEQAWERYSRLKSGRVAKRAARLSVDAAAVSTALETGSKLALFGDQQKVSGLAPFDDETVPDTAPLDADETVPNPAPTQYQNRHLGSAKSGTLIVPNLAPKPTYRTQTINPNSEPKGISLKLVSGGSARELSREEAARTAAEQRLNAMVAGLEPAKREQFWNVIMQADGYAWKIAIDCERTKPGDGKRFIEQNWAQLVADAANG